MTNILIRKLIRLDKAKPRLALLISSLALVCTGCSNYELSLNENVLYTPPDLFKDYQIEDRALHDCVKAAIQDQKARKVEEVHTILCPAGNISDLAGIERFTSVKKLGLAQNNIQKITALKRLYLLEQVNLAGNKIQNAQALEGKKRLALLDLSKNAELNCASTLELMAIETLKLPAHCQQ